MSKDPAFDFSTLKPLGKMLEKLRYLGNQYQNGYDHCYVLQEPSIKTTSATLVSKKNKPGCL
jgi:hypothetical protein